MIAPFHRLPLFLMFLMALTWSILAPPGAHGAGTTAGAAALWRTATTVMQHSVRTVHADGRVTERGCCPSLDASWRITGNCSGHALATRARFWLRGRQSTQLRGATAQAVNAHYIVLLGKSNQPTPVWMRNAHTASRWVRANSDPTSLALYYMCPALIIARFQNNTGPATYRVLGTTTVDDDAVWHLQRTLFSQGELADLYVDRRTFHWVRIVGYVGGCAVCNGPSFQEHFTFDYSRLNAPLHITAPKIGSMTP